MFAAAPDLSSQQVLTHFSALRTAQLKGLLLHANQLQKIKQIKAVVFTTTVE